MPDTPDDIHSWIDDLSPDHRSEVNNHLLEMVRIRLAMSEEEALVPLEIALRGSSNPSEAITTFRAMAASQSRQSNRAREVAAHLEAIVSLVSQSFGL